MKLLPLGSTLVALISTALLSVGCKDTAPTSPPDMTQFVAIDADGNRTPLTLVDYSTREGTAAIGVDDLAQPVEFANDAVQSDATFALVFSQLLTGSSVETPIAKKQIIDGKEVEIRVGKGDWENQIPVIDHWETVAGVIEGRSASYTGTVPNPLTTVTFSSTYRPDGAWDLDPALRIDQNPPPALVLQAVDAAGEAISLAPGVLVIHIMSDNGLKGISGKVMAPARNSAGQAIVLPDGRKVAATVVVTVAEPPAEG